MGVSTFSFHDRKTIIEKMSTDVFDLAIVGGGINGAGVARDAASRGMSVALVESQDFAQGTSSRSSKLIHGGIRYLENLEFGLVFEALSERRLLFEIAPHLVHPLRFVLPLYEGGRVGMFKMGLGMWLYDALSMFEAPEMHERLTPAETRERLPLLRERGLLGSYVYSDAYMDDDRLVIETLRSAVRMGAQAVNFVAATGARMSEGRVQELECEDRLSGRKLTIRARHFVSTVGPWTDILAQNLLHQWKKILRPTKGIHLTFDRRRFPLRQAVVMAADQERRIVFGIPRHEMIIIGTTDTDYPGDPSQVGATADDVRYLLNVAEEYFPGARLKPSDIIASYAGVRPLVDDGSTTESKTSREHLIYTDPRNVTFIAGGKYTTYRRMAAEAVDKMLDLFPLEARVRFGRSRTSVALNPEVSVVTIDLARKQAEIWQHQSGLTNQTISLLVDRHGGEAPFILKALNEFPEFWSDESKLWALEARHAIRQTMCVHLIDFFVRRSPLFLSRIGHGLEFLDTLSEVFADELGWDKTHRQAEVQQVKDFIERELSWKKAFISSGP